MTAFETCLAAVLLEEGGFVNNRNDPGGATDKGVTKAVYDAFRRAKRLPTQSVRLITDTEVREIYTAQFWTAVHGDDLPSGVNLAVFDWAVHSGVPRAIMGLQAAIGATPDGHYGLLTAQAVRGIHDRKAVIVKLSARRLSFLERLRTWKFFRKGWTNRVNTIKAKALFLAGQTQAGV